METGNFTVYVRVSIRKTFAQFLQKKAQIFAFVALHFARKKALCQIIAQILFCAKLRYSVLRNFSQNKVCEWLRKVLFFWEEINYFWKGERFFNIKEQVFAT